MYDDLHIKNMISLHPAETRKTTAAQASGFRPPCRGECDRALRHARVSWPLMIWFPKSWGSPKNHPNCWLSVVQPMVWGIVPIFEKEPSFLAAGTWWLCHKDCLVGLSYVWIGWDEDMTYLGSVKTTNHWSLFLSHHAMVKWMLILLLSKDWTGQIMFPECGGKGSRFTWGLGAEACSLDAALVRATIQTSPLRRCVMSFCVAGAPLPDNDFHVSAEKCWNSLCVTGPCLCKAFGRWVAYFVAGTALWRSPSPFCLAGEAL